MADDPIIKMIRENRGLAVRIAEACGIHRAAVYQWKRVPSERVARVSRVMKVKKSEIRPDLFGKGAK